MFSDLYYPRLDDLNAEEDFTYWDAAMEKYGYTSEHFDIVTEDGYHLTLFHITGKVDGTPLEIT